MYSISLISGDNDLAMLVVSILALVAFLFVGDSLIANRPFFGRPFWPFVDSGVHGLVAFLVTTPIIRRAPTPQHLLALAFLAGTLVDLDHFLVAGPRSFWAATHLGRRPPTHSVTFVLLVSGGGYLFSGSLTTAWVVFAALTSHVLRDPSVGTAPLLWRAGLCATRTSRCPGHWYLQDTTRGVGCQKDTRLAPLRRAVPAPLGTWGHIPLWCD